MTGILLTAPFAVTDGAQRHAAYAELQRPGRSSPPGHTRLRQLVAVTRCRSP